MCHMEQTHSALHNEVLLVILILYISCMMQNSIYHTNLYALKCECAKTRIRLCIYCVHISVSVRLNSASDAEDAMP